MDYQKNKNLCVFLHKSDYSLLLLNIITLFFDSLYQINDIFYTMHKF